MGIRFNVVPRIENKADSIQAARNILPYCVFDESRCDEGIVHLENYRREWDEKKEVWKNNPYHDKHSNGADAFQTLAMGHSFSKAIGRRANQHAPAAAGWT
jgi:hypothetical protein